MATSQGWSLISADTVPLTALPRTMVRPEISANEARTSWMGASSHVMEMRACCDCGANRAARTGGVATGVTGMSWSIGDGTGAGAGRATCPVETLAAGSRLFWDICLDDVTNLEFEAFAAALGEFGRKPYIGGKSAIGHGKVHIRFDDWIEINPRLAPTGREIGLPLGSEYEAHLREHGAEIRSLIDGLT